MGRQSVWLALGNDVELQAEKLAAPPVQMKPSGHGAQRGGAVRRNLPGTQDVSAGEQVALPGSANLFAGQVEQNEDEEAPEFA